MDKKNLRYKGDSYLVKADPGLTATRTVKVARLEYPGNWNPEPGGWRQLAAILHNRQSMDLAVEPVQVGEGKLDGFQVAHLTGTAAFHFNGAQRTEIKRFIKAGGTLIIDAAGGSGGFADSAESELFTLFGDAAKAARQPLPPEHPLYTDSAQKLGPMTYRPFARKTVVGMLTTPRLGGLEIGGRLAVFYSPDDLSVGLVGHPVDGILGYEPESAARLMARLLAFAVEKK